MMDYNSSNSEDPEVGLDVAAIAEDEVFSGSLPIREALERLRLRLLDLTGRNRLLNFKPTTGKALQFVEGIPELVFNRLVNGSANAARLLLAAIPEPERSEWLMKNERLTKPEAREYATSKGISTTFDQPLSAGEFRNGSGVSLRALYYPEDLAKHGRKLEREARLAIEETGSNMLYLVFGLLEFPDTRDSDRLFQAPLVSVPVKLERIERGQYTDFFLSASGEELEDNLSLREKIKRDYGLILPTFDDYEEEGNLGAYFAAVEEAISKQPRWQLRRRVTLTLLSFANMLLVRDLDPAKWPERAVSGKSALLDHPIVRQVFQGAQHERGEGAAYGDEYDIDTHPSVHLPVVYDTDSSQHSALIDVLDGRNLVIEGPPGTGKSQTITNLIAAAIQAGKKVLFVSEKLAALEVVKSRLTSAGLGDFILELHSNKTSKKQMLESLYKREQLQLKSPSSLKVTLDALEQRRNELKKYVDTLKSVQGNQQGLKVYQILGRAELYRQKADTNAASELIYHAAPELDAIQFDSLYSLLTYLGAGFENIGSYDAEHPFWGFFPNTLHPQESLTVERVLNDTLPSLQAFAQAMHEAVGFLDADGMALSSEEIQRLLRVLLNVAPATADEVAFDMLPRLFTTEDPQASRSGDVLADLSARLEEWSRVRGLLAGKWLSDAVVSEVALTAIAEAITLVEMLGELGTDRQRTRDKLSRVQEAIAIARQSLRDVAQLAERVRLPFDGTVTGLRRVHVALDVAETAPEALLHLRHIELAQPQAPVVLAQARDELTTMKAQRRVLDECFYLDMSPSEDALREAILVLREGDTWYRIFQSRWRHAVNVHRQLERQKSKKKGSERLAELEELFLHLQQTRAWSDNEALRRCAGDVFAGEGTPLEDLLQVAEWMVAQQRLLDEARCNTQEISPQNISFGKIVELRELRQQIHLAAQSLPRLLDAFGHEFSQGSSVVNSRLWMESWEERIAGVEAMVATLVQLLELLEPNTTPIITLEQGVAALRARYRQPLLARELAAHDAGRELLGERFVAENTDLEPIEAALIYGRLVKAIALPLPVEGLLLSAASPNNYVQLNRIFGEIARGWEAIAVFAQGMAEIGDFNLGHWAEEHAATGVVYADAMLARVQRAYASMDKLQPWGQYVQQREQVEAKGLLPFVALMEQGTIAPKQLADMFASRFFASIANMLFQSDPVLRIFGGSRHSEVRAEYAELDRKLIKMRGQQIAADAIRQAKPPQGANAIRVGDKTEMALLECLMPQTRPRMAVRKILQGAGRSIQELKPCFMMGPQSVAQFLTPGHLEFDLVVMDEASQLKPEQAIGAIARGKQLVVVGDPKQLPPTSFFSRMNPVDDGAAVQTATDEAESILDVCMGHFQPIRTLRWHYRSRHESLIAFSNQEFYQGRLFIFPSPYPRGGMLGVRYHYLPDAIYENQMNVIEARRVVDAVVERMQRWPDDSLGVVTLNVKQRDLIAELLEERLRGMTDLEVLRARWDSNGHPLFVKNLENVQGDERDCIIISTTFGRAPGVSKPRQNFGPISRDGGWRRLNVLFTRARKSIALYSSLRPEDVVVDHSSPAGARALHNYLKYAATGTLAVPTETGRAPDSEFEEAVIRALQRKGYQVTSQLGVASFRIDIAVRHPEYTGTYIAAIECDGATYHSGISVRDRDRIRQEILESQGWRGKIWRIWSTDWFRNPQGEASKLFSFLEERLREPVSAEFLEEEPSAPQSETFFSQPPVSLPLSDEAILEDDDDEEMEVIVGDIVTYLLVGAAEEKALTVRITTKITNPEQGLIAESTPLAQVLLGATTGQKVTLRVPSKDEQIFIVKAIKRNRVN